MAVVRPAIAARAEQASYLAIQFLLSLTPRLIAVGGLTQNL
jgi:hypothetical protein